MDKDIVPELLANIEQEFDLRTFESSKLKTAIQLLGNKKATYKDVNEFAIEVGEILASTLKGHVTTEALPDGKMYFNIAERILNSTMQKNYDLISNFAADVQTELNHNAGLHLKGQKPLLNNDRIDGIVNRVSSEENFSKIKWILDEPIINFSQSIVDDAIKANADFHAKAGLHPTIERIATGKPCDWCKEVAGIYKYPGVPKDVFRRHGNCQCVVDYNPKSGKRQNVWSKKWKDPQKDDKIEKRKKVNITRDYDTTNYIHNPNGTLKPSRVVQNKVPDNCKAFEVIDVVTSKGNINRTLIDEHGNRGMRIDSTDHGKPKSHPMGSHKHTIEYDEDGNYISDGKVTILTPQDRKENSDIL